MIRTIIFDIGNVLVDFDWDSFLHAQIQDATLVGRLNREVFTERFWKNWSEFDRGVLSDEEIVRRIVADAPEFEAEVRMLLDHAGGCVSRLDYAIPWIRSLKGKGLRVLYLSNYSARLRNANPEALDFLPETDGGIFSYEVGLIKPDPAIYRHICERYALNPSETVFIDDNTDNVAAAEALGLRTIRFVSYPDATERLAEILG